MCYLGEKRMKCNRQHIIMKFVRNNTIAIWNKAMWKNLITGNPRDLNKRLE